MAGAGGICTGDGGGGSRLGALCETIAVRKNSIKQIGPLERLVSEGEGRWTNIKRKKKRGGGENG
jgi:hypothetical protein